MVKDKSLEVHIHYIREAVERIENTLSDKIDTVDDKATAALKDVADVKNTIAGYKSWAIGLAAGAGGTSGIALPKIIGFIFGH